MRILLIHPPFADPTQPYVSLPVLKGHLRSRGLDADLLDLNVEAASWLLAPSTLAGLAEGMEDRWRRLNRKRSLRFEEARQYRLLSETLPRVVLASEAQPGVLETFLSRDLFFDAEAYDRARRLADAALQGLSALFHPFRYSFNHASHDVVPWSFDLLDEHARREGPLDALYERVFEGADAASGNGDGDGDGDGSTCLGLDDDGNPTVDLASAGLIGLSIAFPSQIPEAWRLARLVKRLAPHAFVALGGPAIHQVAVHLEEPLQQRLLDLADGIGLFEGEETLAQLAPRLDSWRSTRDARELFDVPNLMLRDPDTGRPRLGPRVTLDLRNAAPPDPEGLDLDRYLAPSRALLYAPTRGCYWNKCSFCYYGLSETATATYREIPPERAASEMAELSRRHGVTYFYVSCDVLSPVYAVKLSEAMIAQGLQLRWSSDLKIEKWFTKERCRTLAKAGLVAAAFGIESGSDRILALMRKGCDRATMTRVNRDFHDAGIATEWMTFTDHPGESADEALATVSWVEEERDRVGLFIVGEFGLERGSAIFQDPKAFGVEDVWFAEGDELRLYAQFREAGAGRTDAERERIDSEIARVSAGWRLSPYPWAGANSTHHTLLWLMEREKDAFKRDVDVPARVAEELDRRAAEIGLPARPRFDLAAIEEREERFFAGYLRRALYTTLPARRGGPGFALAPLSWRHFEEAAKAVEAVHESGLSRRRPR